MANKVCEFNDENGMWNGFAGCTRFIDGEPLFCEKNGYLFVMGAEVLEVYYDLEEDDCDVLTVMVQTNSQKIARFILESIPDNVDSKWLSVNGFGSPF